MAKVSAAEASKTKKTNPSVEKSVPKTDESGSVKKKKKSSNRTASGIRALMHKQRSPYDISKYTPNLLYASVQLLIRAVVKEINENTKKTHAGTEDPVPHRITLSDVLKVVPCSGECKYGKGKPFLLRGGEPLESFRTIEEAQAYIVSRMRQAPKQPLAITDGAQ